MSVDRRALRSQRDQQRLDSDPMLNSHDAPAEPNCASWIVASSPNRHHMIGAALAHMKAAMVPPGWRAEIVVGIETGDERVRDICEAAGARVVEVSQAGGGPKRNAAIRASRGSLLLVADDDDFVSPTRITYAVAARTQGHLITSSREYRYLYTASGNVVRWKGRANGNGGRQPPIIGASRNFDRATLVKARGYNNLPRLLETDLQRRITHSFRIQDKDLSEIKTLGDISSMWTGTICTQHGGNIWKDRQDVPKGEKFVRGGYLLVGEGHWSELADFPPSVVAALALR